jgi:hypothetical protein
VEEAAHIENMEGKNSETSPAVPLLQPNHPK